MIDPFLEPKNIKLHEWNIIRKRTVISDSITTKTVAEAKPAPSKTVPWGLSDVAKAGRILASPPVRAEFLDEQEMRRVYSLIYDVFRYKSVLKEALDDISFFQLFPKLLQSVPHVWLLFYDLYHREFKKREGTADEDASKLLADAGLTFAENALFTQKVKLAAAVARIRIKHNALTLNDLLPPHLKDQRVTDLARKAPVTCWVNAKKIMGESNICQRIQKIFNLTAVENVDRLGPNNFKWDKHCPQIIAFHSSMRPSLARSTLVRSHELVVQDKTFCLGPATFVKIVAELELTGSVIQTHIHSPRSTAYLASILALNAKIKKVMAFSAGQRKSEYEDYFDRLGIDNVVIFADRLVDLSPDSLCMEEVVAIFATPPNSYSAVNDPVDLVCSRGGDLSMVEVLTESEETKEGKERRASINDEQRNTLRFAMSRPQIQFVLYETHSEMEDENSRLVQSVLQEVNKIVKIHHAALQGKLILESSDTSTNLIHGNQSDDSLESRHYENVERNSLLISETTRLSSIDSNDSIFDNLSIPDADLFDTSSLPSLSQNKESRLDLAKEGCYLALLQRKQVINVDNRNAINAPGFYESIAAGRRQAKGSRSSKKKSEKASTRHGNKIKRKLSNPEGLRQELKENVEHDADDIAETADNKEVVVKYMNPRKILGRLSVYQLRELVSASYRGQSIYRERAQNVKGKDTISGGSKQSRRSKNNKGVRGTRTAQDTMNDFIARLCTPTQASLCRSCRHIEENQPNKSAMEYATREFKCERCRRRNLNA